MVSIVSQSHHEVVVGAVVSALDIEPVAGQLDRVVCRHLDIVRALLNTRSDIRTDSVCGFEYLLHLVVGVVERVLGGLDDPVEVPEHAAAQRHVLAAGHAGAAPHPTSDLASLRSLGVLGVGDRDLGTGCCEEVITYYRGETAVTWG